MNRPHYRVWIKAGDPALDNSTPLFAFLFLAALGVDYTIFLVTHARQEAAQHGAPDGMIRAVSAIGGVIRWQAGKTKPVEQQRVLAQHERSTA
jgi:MMPL family